EFPISIPTFPIIDLSLLSSIYEATGNPYRSATFAIAGIYCTKVLTYKEAVTSSQGILFSTLINTSIPIHHLLYSLYDFHPNQNKKITPSPRSFRKTTR